ncbi:hypothetical protein D3C87_2123330 [compost metagenome]
MGSEDRSSLTFLDDSISQRFIDDLVDHPSFGSGAHRAAVQLDVVQGFWIGNRHEHAAIE